MSDFKSLRDTYPKDSDYPPRTHLLIALTRVLDGTLYDDLEYPFSTEKNGAGEYIPLGKRRPSARNKFCRTVVNDSTSLLFSEGHFPSIECSDEVTRDTLTKLMRETGLNWVMIDASARGAVGSVVIAMRVLASRVFFDAMPTAYLTPAWEPQAPDTLKSVTEKRKVKGAVLASMGYVIADADATVDFWFQRIWDSAAETWFVPQRVDEKDMPLTVDAKNSTKHSLGFVPMVWVKNLPGGDAIDGDPTFPIEAIDTQIEADYLLSQGGRGLKYSADPTLHLKEPAFGEQATVVRGAANAIVTSTDGDAKLLEINGTAAAAVLDWVKGLREIALESMGGNRSNADKLSAAQSGRAMELMNQTLIWLADKLRISYGEGALLSLLNMVVAASSKFDLVDKKGRRLPKLSDEDLSLRWPQWYAPTFADKQTQAMTLDVLRQSGLISLETAIKSLASSYDIADPEDELKLIAADSPPPNLPPKPQQNPLADSDD